MLRKTYAVSLITLLAFTKFAFSQELAASDDMSVSSERLYTDIQQYDNGGIYEGQFHNGVQHGQGTYRLPNGYEYIGAWVDGEIRGQGSATFPDGSIYEGAFVAGHPEGQGRITFVDGSTYEGDWAEGRIHGSGVANYSNGVSYTGEFRNALHHGQGVMTGPGGYRYEGEWEEGVKQGQGTITYPDGATYEGGFVADQRAGTGRLVMPDGVTYEGEWADGQINGTGTLTQPNGDVYEGGLANGQRQGSGTVRYANGDVYEGEFRDDQRYGTGTFTAIDGYVYTGDWAEGQISGEGRVTYPDGSVYEGGFANDLAHGTGTITYPDGASYTGDWVEGVIQGQGTATYANGLTYVGQFLNARQHGQGVMTHPDGYRYEGQWENGLRHGQGRATYTDGSVYDGTFVAGVRSGQGRLTMPEPNAFSYVGEWANGEINGFGIATYSNGDIYEGRFVDGRREGEGTMRYASGEVWRGTWENGQPAGPNTDSLPPSSEQPDISEQLQFPENRNPNSFEISVDRTSVSTTVNLDPAALQEEAAVSVESSIEGNAQSSGSLRPNMRPQFITQDVTSDDIQINWQTWGPAKTSSTFPGLMLINEAIDQGAAQAVLDALNFENIQAVILDSPGGVVAEALEIAEVLRERQVVTYVPSGAHCQSSCVYMFLGGTRRLAEGSLSVHQLRAQISTHAPISVDVDEVMQHSLEFASRILELGAPSWLVSEINSSRELVDLTVEQRQLLSLDAENLVSDYGLPSMQEISNALTDSTFSIASAAIGPIVSIGPLGNFRLGHNVVVVDNVVMRTEESLDWNAADIEDLFSARISERFGHHAGSRIYHTGIAVDGIICNPDGRNIAAIALSVNIWDDVLGRKIHDRPYAVRMQEPLDSLSQPYRAPPCNERIIAAIDSALSAIEIIILMNPSFLEISPDAALLEVNRIIRENSEPSFYYSLAELLSQENNAEIFDGAFEMGAIYAIRGMQMGRRIWQSIGLEVADLSVIPELTPYSPPVENRLVVQRIQEFLNRHFGATISEDGLFGAETKDAMDRYVYGFN
jgi:ATP-dependent protease ClpP protease subunit